MSPVPFLKLMLKLQATVWGVRSHAPFCNLLGRGRPFDNALGAEKHCLVLRNSCDSLYKEVFVFRFDLNLCHFVLSCFFGFVFNLTYTISLNTFPRKHVFIITNSATRTIGGCIAKYTVECLDSIW